jgi:hypothetical protein
MAPRFFVDAVDFDYCEPGQFVKLEMGMLR